MDKLYQTQQIAAFALKARFEDLPSTCVDQLKRHLLDAVGSMLHATTRPSIQKLIRQMKVLGEGGRCKVPLLGYLPYDRAAQLYTALLRYPNFMDSFMGKGATCHPSDNIGALLAISQYKNVSGREFLTAMAVAYQIECRLIEEIPVLEKGKDHTVVLAYSVTAALCKLVGLNHDQAADALGIAGCAINSMVTKSASYASEWKGFASSLDALNCTNIVLLVEQGITGPFATFEGPKGVGYNFGLRLDYNWKKEHFSLIAKCVIKAFNAEVHSQSLLEALLILKIQHDVDPADISRINLTTFLPAYNIIGGGLYGDRKVVSTKEQADHSLFYLAAVLMLDGEVYPEQFEPERINRADVQALLKRVSVSLKFTLHKPTTVTGNLDSYTSAYPDKMKAKVEIVLKNGNNLVCETDDYHGFFTRPFSWEDTIIKFKRLAGTTLGEPELDAIINNIRNLDDLPLMMPLLNQVSMTGTS